MSVVNHRATPAGVAQQSSSLPPGTRLGEFRWCRCWGGRLWHGLSGVRSPVAAFRGHQRSTCRQRSPGAPTGIPLWVRSSSDEQSFQAGLASFVDEALPLARFEHPSLVKVLRFWEANHTREGGRREGEGGREGGRGGREGGQSTWSCRCTAA